VLATESHPSVVLPGTLAPEIRYVRPNPAASSASIGYSLSLPAGWRFARISIYDVCGRVVRTFDPARGTRGFLEAAWDGIAESGESVVSGVYFVRLEVDGASDKQKVVLLR